VRTGTTNVIDLNLNASGICTSTVCSYKPATTLAYGNFTWRVRTYMGAWQAYTDYSPFSVNSTTAGRNFVNYFTADAPNWKPILGTWGLSNGAYKTPGVLNYIASVAHDGSYTSSDYLVTMMRLTDPYSANRLYVRGNPSTLEPTSKSWSNGYIFQYANSGSYSIFKVVNGTFTSLVSWTPSAYIIPYGWNTLEVKVKNYSYQFFINNHLVASGTAYQLYHGQVGIGDFEQVNGAMFYVDYARLSTTVSLSEASVEEGVATFDPRSATAEEVNHSPIE
jgi:hypothetical protein